MEEFKSQEGYTLKTEELLLFLDNLKIQENQVFHFGSIQFQILFINESEVDNDTDTFWSTSTEINGYDIYILRSLSKEIKKRRLFYELLEIDLLTQGISSDKSHPIVLTEEERIFGVRAE